MLLDVKLLEELSNACGVAGDEGEVREVLRRHLAPHVDEIYTDSIGNLICRKGSGPVRAMLDAHMDEVGFLVTGHDDNGLVRFRESGLVDPRVLPGRAVLIGRLKIPGVIGAPAVHLVEAEDRDRVLPARKLRVDIGARSRDEAAAVAPLGEPVYFATRFERLSDRVVKGKAFDDRMGCAVVAAALRGPGSPGRAPRGGGPGYPGLTLYGVFSVQEEVGLRGAQVASQHVAPQVALAVEGTSSANVPGVEPPQTATHMGEGPAVSLMDGSLVTHERVREQLVALAQEHGVPFQFRRLTTAGTDAGGIFLQGKGIPACTLSVPCRYIHGPVALADLEDADGAVKLVQLFLDSLDKGDFAL